MKRLTSEYFSVDYNKMEITFQESNSVFAHTVTNIGILVEYSKDFPEDIDKGYWWKSKTYLGFIEAGCLNLDGTCSSVFLKKGNKIYATRLFVTAEQFFFEKIINIVKQVFNVTEDDIYIMEKYLHKYH
jgi:hypothetical protein